MRVQMFDECIEDPGAKVELIEEERGTTTYYGLRISRLKYRRDEGQTRGNVTFWGRSLDELKALVTKMMAVIC
jgi:hypothetical protein